MLTPPGRRTSIVGDDGTDFVTVVDGNDGGMGGGAGTGVDTTGGDTGSITPVDDTSATWTKPGSDADDSRLARIDQYRTMLNDTPRCRANALID